MEGPLKEAGVNHATDKTEGLPEEEITHNDPFANPEDNFRMNGLNTATL